MWYYNLHFTGMETDFERLGNLPKITQEKKSQTGLPILNSELLSLPHDPQWVFIVLT